MKTYKGIADNRCVAAKCQNVPEIRFPQFAKSSDDMIAAKKGFFCAAVRQCSDVIAKDNFRYIISTNLQAIEIKSDWTKKKNRL